MKKLTCDLFFEVLAEEWNDSIELILFGGAAAQVWGSHRPTEDVDFEVRKISVKKWPLFKEVVQRAEEKSGVRAQFGRDLEKTSPISYIDYREHLQHYHNYGKIKLMLPNPLYWSIGKVARYWDVDVHDMVEVFKNLKVTPALLSQIWKHALKETPNELEQKIVSQNATHFFQAHAPQIWGQSLSF